MILIDMAKEATWFQIKSIDFFAVLNITLFLLMCYSAYFDRFVEYRGHEYIFEFMVYATVILILIFFAWKTARRFHVPGWLLALAQIGICIHFAGGLAVFGDKRLYDHIIFGVRYDKYVHLFNAVVACLFVQRLILQSNLTQGWLCDLVVVLTVLGLGAFVEIIEYIVLCTVKVNGVGNYDNNMQDLIANFTGVILCVCFARIVRNVKIS